MKLPVRVIVGAFGAFMVALTASLVGSISYVQSRSLLEATAKAHAEALGSHAHFQTEQFFHNPAVDSSAAQQKLQEHMNLPYPTEDPDPNWYQKWWDIMEEPQRGKKSYTLGGSVFQTFFVLFDDSVFRIRVVPHPVTGAPVITYYAYAVTRTKVIMKWALNRSDLAEDMIFPYMIPDRNGTAFPALPYPWNFVGENASDAIVWRRCALAIDNENLVPGMGSEAMIRNRSGVKMGTMSVTLVTLGINRLLSRIVESAEGSVAILARPSKEELDSRIFGTSLPVRTVFEIPYNETNGTLPYPDCATTPPTLSGQKIVCPHTVVTFPFPSIRAAIQSNYNSTRVETDGKSYYIFQLKVENMNSLGFDPMVLFLFYSEDQVNFGMRVVLAVSLAISMVIMLASVGGHFIGVATILHPVTVVTRRIAALAILQGLEEPFEPSRIREVDALCSGAERLRIQLKCLKPYLPLSLLGGDTEDPTSEKTVEEAHSMEFTEITFPATGNEGAVGVLDTDQRPVVELPVNQSALQDTLNVFHQRQCAVMSVKVCTITGTSDCGKQLSHKTRDTENVCKCVLNAVVEQVTRFGGIVEFLSPFRSWATFNAHKPCYNYNLKAALCSLEVCSIVHKKIPSLEFSIVVDSGSVFIGSCGHNDVRARTTFSGPVEGLRQLHKLAHRILGSPVLITDRVAAKISLPAMLVEIVQATTQSAGKQQTALYEPIAGSAPPEYSLLRSVFSLLVKAEFASAIDLIEASNMAYLHHCTRLLRTSKFCLEHRRSTFVRSENLDTWEILDDPVLEEMSFRVSTSSEPDTSRAQNTYVAPKDEVQRMAADLQWRPEMHEVDTGLFEIFVEGNQEALSRADNLPRRFRDGNRTEWLSFPVPIGVGACAKVYRVLSIAGDTAAAKYFTRAGNDEYASFAPISIVEELSTLIQLQHENVVTYSSCCVVDGHAVLLMEYIPQTLCTVIDHMTCLPLPVIRRFSRDILRGLSFLHHRGVVHCDVKPSNILVTSDGTCKISDFGHSFTTASCKKTNDSDKAMDFVPRGTPSYVAPEVAGGKQPSPAADIWAFGLTALQMATGRTPWKDPPKRGTVSICLFVQRLATDASMVPIIPEDLDDELREVLEKCLARDPLARPSADALSVMTFFA